MASCAVNHPALTKRKRAQAFKASVYPGSLVTSRFAVSCGSIGASTGGASGRAAVRRFCWLPLWRLSARKELCRLPMSRADTGRAADSAAGTRKLTEAAAAVWDVRLFASASPSLCGLLGAGVSISLAKSQMRYSLFSFVITHTYRSRPCTRGPKHHEGRKPPGASASLPPCSRVVCWAHQFGCSGQPLMHDPFSCHHCPRNHGEDV